MLCSGHALSPDQPHHFSFGIWVSTLARTGADCYSIRTGRQTALRQIKVRHMKILSCNSNRPMAEAIAAYLDVPLTKADVKRFADMEVFVEISENVRGEDVFVVQSTCFPANDNVMELLVALDGCAVAPRAGSRLSSPITAMHAKTGNLDRARPSRQNYSQI